VSDRAPAPDWQPFPEDGAHPLARLHGATVGEGVTLVVEVASHALAGVGSFRAFLRSAELGTTRTPVLRGIFPSGQPQDEGLDPPPDLTWLFVTDFAATLTVEQGQVEVPEGIDLLIVQTLAGLVRAGGYLSLEYDSEHRRTTARALAQGVPPAATPLGGMMFSAGCGVAIIDRYTSDGGVAGPRALQGFRAADIEHERRRAPQTLAALERFMGHSADLDWDLQVKCRPLAEAAITVLRARLGVLSREFTDGANGSSAPGAPPASGT
jgi:hypothetical protein